MAFQTGTRVDPRLGALDFSGFTNAANIQAASLLKLGEAIGGAIEEHQEKKIKKQQDKVNIKAIKELSDLYNLNLDDDTIKAVYKNDVVRDIFKLGFDQDSTTPQLTPAALKSAGQMFEEGGFEYDNTTGKMIKQEGPGFFGGIANKFVRGQPFTPDPVEFPQQIIDTTKGASEFIENKRIMAEQEMMPDIIDIGTLTRRSSNNNTDMVLMVDREGLPRKVAREDVEEAIQNGYRL